MSFSDLWGRGMSTEQIRGIKAGDAKSALRLPAVWSCVRLLSFNLARMDLDAFDSITQTEKTRAVIQPELLDQPSAHIEAFTWKQQVMTSLQLRGNAYGLVTKVDRVGTPSRVELLSPDNVMVRLDQGRVQEYVVTLEGGQHLRLGPGELWHVRGLTLPGEDIGLSVISYHRMSIESGLAAQRYGVDWFNGGGLPSLVFGVPPETVATAGQLEATSDMLHERLRAGKPLVVRGDVNVDPVQVTAEEAQFLETQRFSVADIARLFGVSPSAIGGDAGGSMTYSNVEQQSLEFLTYGLGPWMSLIEESISTLMYGRFKVRFNTGDFLRTDAKTQAQVSAIRIKGGWGTKDEARYAEGRPPAADEKTGSDKPADKKIQTKPTDVVAKPAAAAAEAKRMAEVVQKIYLGVGSVVQRTEARQLLKDAGMDIQPEEWDEANDA